MKRPAFHIDCSLSDFEGETWVDVIGYDGIYNVSNLGRVKSLRRYSSANRIVKERILKQYISHENQSSVKLAHEGHKKTFNVTGIVANAFLRDRVNGECVIHLNKVKYDNRLTNLKIGTQSESGALNYKLSVSKDWGISSVGKKIRSEFEKNNVILEDGEMKIVCQKCFFEKSSTDFYLRSENNFHRHICKACQLVEMGVKEVGKLSDRISLAKSGLRYCSICKVLKSLDTDFCRSRKSFMGKSNNCRDCAKIINDRNNLKRKIQ